MDEGWCEGVLNGKKGMFPDNFVKIREPTKPPPVIESNGVALAQIRGELETRWSKWMEGNIEAQGWRDRGR